MSNEKPNRPQHHYESGENMPTLEEVFSRSGQTGRDMYQRQLERIRAIKPVEKYNPAQPRHPQGTPVGGQWSGGEGSGAAKQDWRAMGGYKESPHEPLVLPNGVNMSREEFAKAMLGDFADKVNPAEVHLSQSRDGAHIKFDVAGQNGLDLQRSIRLDQKTVYHEGMVITLPELKGTGLGKSVMRSQIDLYKKLGIETVRLNANITVGAYVWPKYGFLPTNAQDFEGIVSAGLDDLIGHKGYDQAEKFIAGVWDLKDGSAPNYKAAWDIVDSKINITFNKDFKVPLGKALLIGDEDQGYEAILDLTDPEAMKRFDKYAGSK